MERLTKYVTPVGACMTSLNSLDHYMPCVPCRHRAVLKVAADGTEYTEKFSFCDTCEVKVLFNRLAEYEDTGLTPEEVAELKFRMEGLDK